LDSFSIEKSVYSKGAVTRPDRNLFTTILTTNKFKKITSLTQAWLEKNQERLVILYNSKEDKSYIFKTNLGKKTQKEVKNGIVLLYVKTNNGNLEFGYE
jgi:hypothetical protein